MAGVGGVARALLWVAICPLRIPSPTPSRFSRLCPSIQEVGSICNDGRICDGVEYRLIDVPELGYYATGTKKCVCVCLCVCVCVCLCEILVVEPRRQIRACVRRLPFTSSFVSLRS